MLFHEIYGSYFRTVSLILKEACAGGISEKRMMDIVSENAFAESTLTIPEKLKSGEWPLLKPRTGKAAGKSLSGQKVYDPVLYSAPGRPLTLHEKQWLKAILKDPRIRLFCWREEDMEGLRRLESLLSEVQPLYDPDTFVYYDRNKNGDDYTDERYVRHFHEILKAIHEKRMLYVNYAGRNGRTRGWLHFPYGIEYSSRDDKFRVLCRSMKGTPYTINVSRIRNCEAKRYAAPEEMELPRIRKCRVDLELTDERNTLQRAMLHFSDLQKETEKIDELHYRIRLYYYRDDETEIVIRILSFGPTIRVLGPDKFIYLIRERIEKQERLCGL